MKTYYIIALLFLSVISHAQIVDIPDTNLKNALVNLSTANLGNSVFEIADTNGDGEIQITEAQTVSNLLLEQQNIMDTTGLEAFLILEGLIIDDNPLSSLDVTQNANLIGLSCSLTELTTLNVTQNPNLVSLDCGGVFLTEMDVTQNPNLKYLGCYGNTISTLDLTQNPEIETLYLDANNLTSLDLSNNTKLKKLWSGSNLFTTIDLSNNPL